MRKIYLVLLTSSMFAIHSCSSDSDSNNNTAGVDHSKVSTGWWYPNAEDGMDWKGRLFEDNGEYKQDQSNFGLDMGIGTWEWIPGDTLKVTPVSGFSGGVAKLKVIKLTSDSLVIDYGTLHHYSHTEN
ncbi:MAG TPA: hypothetical protein VK623_07525 [Flavobacterium sp.]|nr:hypothetical protein [Flavobacterium sp.]